LPPAQQVSVAIRRKKYSKKMKEKMKKVDILSKKISFIFAFTIAFTFYPLFYVLDIIIYPEFKFELLQIRLSTMGVFVILLLLISRLKEHILMTLIFIAAALSITLMCYVTGDGFSSSYYSGVILCIIVSSVFFRIKNKYYIVMMLIIVLLHFFVLSFIPFQITDLMKNAFFVGSAALFTIVVHAIILYFSVQLKVLKDLLPICAKCKKIRDDKGYWNQMEKYITEHSGAQFTHGLCPKCAEELYGTIGLGDKEKGY
jgi:hypothetical protein